VILELQKHETGLFNPIVLGMVKKFPAFYKTWLLPITMQNMHLLL